MSDSLMPIGKFARASGLSAKALRHYSDLGLLKPAKIDPVNGYRWFAKSQVAEAGLIRLLRRLDMPLAEIRLVLGVPDPAARWEHIRTFWSRQRQTLAERERLLAQLHSLVTGSDLTGFRVQVFEGLGEDVLVELGRRMIPISLPADVPLFKQGDPGDALFVIQSGSVRVVFDRAMPPMLIAQIGEGDLVGEMGVLNNKPRNASVYTESPCELLKLTRQDFLEISAAFPEVTTRVRDIADRRRKPNKEAYQ